MTLLRTLAIVGSLLLVSTAAVAKEPTRNVAETAPQAGPHNVIQPTGARPAPITLDPELRARSIEARPLPKLRSSSFEFPAPQALTPDYVGEERLLRPFVDAEAPVRPTALAADHFDQDGTLDLVAGYTSPDGHRLTLHRGNLDAIYPNSPAARQRKAQGTFTDAAFLTPGRVFDVPAEPDFIGTGDFDNDGYRDVVIAALGDTNLYLLPGDGQGGFRQVRPVTLDGPVTTMISGEINRRDGLADLVVGIAGDEGAAVLVFESPEGALTQEPERISVATAPTALALGRLDDEGPLDLALGVGPEVMILHGRDRQLTVHAERRRQVGPAVLESVAELDRSIASIAVGHYLWDNRRRAQLAVLSTDGTLQVMGRGANSGEAAWDSIGERRVLEGVLPGHQLVTARVSALPLDEVVVLDRDGQSLHLLLGEVPVEGEPLSGNLGISQVATLSGSPAAILPMHLNGDARSDLVLLQEGVVVPATATSSPAAAIVVDATADFGFPTETGDGFCQLSEAIMNANINADLTGGDCPAGSGADAILFLGVSSVAVAVPLPSLTDPGDLIDGTGTVGFCANIEGGTFGVPGPGLTLTGGTQTVRGVAIWGFGGDGVSIGAPGGSSIVDGTFIGVSCGAISTVPNGRDGIQIVDSAANLIGGPGGPPQSFILENGANGIAVLESLPGLSVGNRVISNFIGTDGFGARPNATNGIVLVNTDDAIIGGTAPGEGNTISGNGLNGIELFPSFDPNEDNLVQGNFIGTDSAGGAAVPNNSNGIFMTDGRLNTVGGTSPGALNVISGNLGEGVFLRGGGIGGSVDNTVQGNHIGVDLGGGSGIGNGSLGVRVEDSSANFIGGSAPGAGNVISANASFGIGIVTFVDPALVSNNTVQGNLIGLDAGGSLGLGHSLSGIIIQDSSNNLIGGGLPGEGNVSSGNGQTGVFVVASSFVTFETSDNRIQGNFLGTDITGTVSLGNGLHGFGLQEADGNHLGGSNPGEGNLLSGNLGSGAFIASFVVPGGSANNTVEGNVIGLDAGGAPMANAAAGITVQDAPNNTIGGIVPGAGNTIHSNGGPGIGLVELAPYPTTGNRILGNSIFDNFDLGIDLLFDGLPQPNDPLDTDPGPNRLQNHPMVTRADVGLSETVIEGIVESTPLSSFRVELFSSPACDPSGFGEGRDLRAFVDVPTDSAGFGAFSVIVPTPIGVGVPITVTGTDNGTQDTSEFSPCLPVSPCVFTPFGQTVRALDPGTLVWPAPADANFVKGPLSAVGTYTVSGSGTLSGTNLDISIDNPVSGAGFYYLLRLAVCGSWQNAAGTEPQRDLLLP